MDPKAEDLDFGKMNMGLKTFLSKRGKFGEYEVKLKKEQSRPKSLRGHRQSYKKESGAPVASNEVELEKKYLDMDYNAWGYMFTNMVNMRVNNDAGEALHEDKGNERKETVIAEPPPVANESNVAAAREGNFDFRVSYRILRPAVETAPEQVACNEEIRELIWKITKLKDGASDNNDAKDDRGWIPLYREL